ncbi:thioredoxin domain-containing protein [Oceanispirochaeta sp.]|uniref:thioredoxin domain-containing protein n=1 Tax=Oceanispirochaeta sp. TaxID=2035350 RepID=UPI002601CA83|nr:thioredoxin domain-containing protein [Oceanispirochaeta sp.]MDA3956208.1 thioredoxin domain-containing protein [Oceanispirochaeta sp.]
MANTNRLINEPSPYLQQHAHNPVHWYPWGDEAFNKAAEENKPIIISIGYSSCHWCHVMEEESFENEEVARLMNEHFISIKVDREERPDIDAHYMNALQMITGRGGWPMNMFALPDGSPFYGGTYFPRDQWMNLLTLVAGQYKSNTEEMVRAAESIEQGISNFKIKLLETEESPYSIDQLGSSVAQTSPQFDLINGGISGAPKFPMPVFTRFLLSWSVLQNDPETRDFVLLTLDKMAAGGIYDQIGGGFSRYSTDVKWKVPHFEKMLYDNAQLLSLYAKAYSLTKKEQYKNVVYQTMDYIEESMTSPRGIFYSALDADSEGEEGLFYTWEKRELLELLAEDYPLAKEYYGIGVAGAWEGGKNILLRPDLQDSQNPAGKDLERIRSILKEARDKRVPPRQDDKSLTSRNALMIIAYIDAFNAFGAPRFLHNAEQATDFILENQLQPDGSLYHAFKDNRSYID